MEYPKIKDFRDFIDKADKIKEKYGGVLAENFNYEYAIGWREYIYTRTNIALKLRHCMWEYLNDDLRKTDLVMIYLANKKGNYKF